VSWVRSIALFLSAALHAALLLFFASRSNVLGLEDGKGRDDVTVAIPISVVNSDLLGLNERNAEASEAAAPAIPAGRERQEPVTERTVQTAAAETSARFGGKTLRPGQEPRRGRSAGRRVSNAATFRRDPAGSRRSRPCYRSTAHASVLIL
jgi:hypothetical protein